MLLIPCLVIIALIIILYLEIPSRILASLEPGLSQTTSTIREEARFVASSKRELFYELQSLTETEKVIKQLRAENAYLRQSVETEVSTSDLQIVLMPPVTPPGTVMARQISDQIINFTSLVADQGVYIGEIIGQAGKLWKIRLSMAPGRKQAAIVGNQQIIITGDGNGLARSEVLEFSEGLDLEVGDPVYMTAPNGDQYVLGMISDLVAKDDEDPRTLIVISRAFPLQVGDYLRVIENS